MGHGDRIAEWQLAKVGEGFAHQVQDTERMLETRVTRPGPDARREPELLNPLEAQEGRRVDQRQLFGRHRNAVVELIADRGYGLRSEERRVGKECRGRWWA